MYFLARKAKGLKLPARVLDEKGFLRLCARLDVEVVSYPPEIARINNKTVEGAYTMIDGKYPCIGIASNIIGMARVLRGTHELAHHLLHSPSTCFYSPHLEESVEREAKQLSALLILPTPVMRMPLFFAELRDEYGLPEDFLWFRKELYETYKV